MRDAQEVRGLGDEYKRQEPVNPLKYLRFSGVDTSIPGMPRFSSAATSRAARVFIGGLQGSSSGSVEINV